MNPVHPSPGASPRAPGVAAAIPWILVAVAREHLHFRRHCHILRRLPLSTPAWLCRHGAREFLLAETGMGGDNVRRTLERLTNLGAAPSLAIFAGFAGGLAEGYAVGDIVTADALDRSPLVTSDHPIATPAEKRQLAQESGAVAVDMESSHFIRWCEEHGLGWRCVRVISDDVDTALAPEVFGLLEDGRVVVRRLIGSLLRRPGLIRDLCRLGRSTNLAAHKLAEALFTERISPATRAP